MGIHKVGIHDFVPTMTCQEPILATADTVHPGDPVGTDTVINMVTGTWHGIDDMWTNSGTDMNIVTATDTVTDVIMMPMHTRRFLTVSTNGIMNSMYQVRPAIDTEEPIDVMCRKTPDTHMMSGQVPVRHTTTAIGKFTNRYGHTGDVPVISAAVPATAREPGEHC